MDLDKLKRVMHSGDIYYETSELLDEQARYNEYNFQYNQLSPSDSENKQRLLRKLFGSVGKNVTIMQPVNANWGKNTHFGEGVYANFNLCLVDDTTIKIGADTMIGPNVTIVAGTHPLDPSERRKKAQYNLPVTIGENVWIGAGVTILPGVTIGDNSVIGAGSLVTKDVPSNVLGVGTPCRIVKSIKENGRA